MLCVCGFLLYCGFLAATPALADYPSVFSLGTYHAQVYPGTGRFISSPILLRDQDKIGVAVHTGDYSNFSTKWLENGVPIIFGEVTSAASNPEVGSWNEGNSIGTVQSSSASAFSDIYAENGSVAVILRNGSSVWTLSEMPSGYPTTRNQANKIYRVFTPASRTTSSSIYAADMSFYCEGYRDSTEEMFYGSVGCGPDIWSSFGFAYLKYKAGDQTIAGILPRSLQFDERGGYVFDGDHISGTYPDRGLLPANPWPATITGYQLLTDVYHRIFRVPTRKNREIVRSYEWLWYKDDYNVNSVEVKSLIVNHTARDGSDPLSVYPALLRSLYIPGYTEGVDYILINGLIDWGLPGKEPAVGHGYSLSCDVLTSSSGLIPTGDFTRPAPSNAPPLPPLLTLNHIAFDAASVKLLDVTDWGLAAEWHDLVTGDTTWGAFRYSLYGRVAMADAVPEGTLSLRLRHIRDSRDYPFAHPAYPYTVCRTPDGTITHNPAAPDQFENAIDADGFFVINRLGGEKLIAGIYELTVLLDGKPVWGPVEISTSNPEINITVPPLTGIQKDQSIVSGCNIGNGNLILERPDIALANPGIALGVTRYFNSLDWDVARNAACVSKDATVSDRAFVPAPFGARWTAGFNAAIFPIKSSYAAGDRVLLRDGSGAYYSFQYAGSGAWNPPAGLAARLVGDGKNFTLTDNNATTYAFAGTDSGVARLTTISSPACASPLTVSYANLNAGIISRIESAGRALVFAYHPSTQLVKSVSVEGTAQKWDYYYDNISADWHAKLIKAVGHAGTVTEEYAYDGARLTGVTRNGVALTVAYDADTRVISLNPPERPLTIAYSGANRVVTEPAGAGGAQTTTYTTAGARRQVTAVDDGAAVTTIAWDANHNVKDLATPTGDYHFSYDGLSNLTQAATPSGTHQWQYHATAHYTPTRSLPQRYEPPSGSADAVGYGYDAASGRLQYMTRAGEATQFTNYTPLEQAGQVQYPSATGLDNDNFSYDARGNMTAASGQQTITQLFPTEEARILGRPSKVTQDGRQVTLSYNALGQVTEQSRQVTTPFGAIVTMTDKYEYDALGRMTKHIAPDGTAITYSHNPAGRVTGQTVAGLDAGTGAPLTIATATTYSGNGEVTEQTDAGGTTLHFTYDNRGQITREEWDETLAPAASATACFITHEYSTAGLKTAQGGNAGPQVATTYNASGQMTARTADGVTEEFTYDGAGRLHEWGPTHRTAERTYATTSTTTEYSGTAYGSGATRIYTEQEKRDALDRVTALTGRDDHYTTTGGGSGGFVLTDRRFTYDNRGRQTQETRGGGSIVTNNTYDANNRLTATTGPGGNATAYTYNELGWVTSATANGITRYYEYDDMGRVIREYSKDVSGSPIQVIERGFNGLGWLLWEKQGGVETKYGYDALGRVIREEVVGSGVYTTSEYSGRRGLLLKRQVIANGLVGGVGAGTVLQTWHYGYDPRGGLLWDEAPGGLRRDYEYNSDHRLVKVSDNAGRVQTYAYNAYGEVEIANHAGAVTEYDYNARGWRDAITLPGGITTATEYDGLGRPALVTEPTGATARLEYQTDRYQPFRTQTVSGPTCMLPGGMTPPPSLLLASFTPSGLLQYRQFGGITENNTFISERLQMGSVQYPGLPWSKSNQLVRYGWSYGLPSSVESNGRTASYGYDLHGRLDRISSSFPPGSAPRQRLYYDAAGRVARTDLPFAGRYTTREYTLTSELKSEVLHEASGGEIWKTEYQYDEAGNRISESFTGSSTSGTPGTHGYSHEYDLAGRITASSDSYGNRIEYTYDARGNRLTERELAGGTVKIVTTSTYSDRDEIISQTTTNAAGDLLREEVFTFDEKGRQTSVTRTTTAAAKGLLHPDGTDHTVTAGTITKTFIWDNFDHLAAVAFSDSRPIITYTYDGAGRRVRRDRGSDSTIYIYDQTTDNVLAELDGSGRTRALYTNGRTQDELIIKHVFNQAGVLRYRVYFLTSGRPVRERILYDEETGEDREEQFYLDPFGRSFPRATLIDLPRYAGKSFDRDAGLFYNSARWLALNGRFISRDPIEPEPGNGTLEIYAFVNCMSNPFKYVDPTGEVIETVWDAASLGLGVASLGYNLHEGNYGYAALDALGVVVDAAAVATPFVPGGAGAIIKASRATGMLRAAKITDQTVNVTQGAYQAQEEYRAGNYGMGSFYAGMSAFGGLGLSRELRTPLSASNALKFTRQRAISAGDAVLSEHKRLNFSIYETLYEAPITGTTRPAHRTSANKFLHNELQQNPDFNSLLSRELGADVLGHMQSGKYLLNPPGTVWHHPRDNPDVVRLMRVEEHTEPALQSVLHLDNIGGYGMFYGE